MKICNNCVYKGQNLIICAKKNLEHQKNELLKSIAPKFLKQKIKDVECYCYIQDKPQ